MQNIKVRNVPIFVGYVQSFLKNILFLIRGGVSIGIFNKGDSGMGHGDGSRC